MTAQNPAVRFAPPSARPDVACPAAALARRPWLAALAAALTFSLLAGPIAEAQPPFEMSESADGFLEPYRTIDVASAEAGVIRELRVREGDSVQSGQILGNLRDEEIAAALRVAEAEKDARGPLRAAQAELEHHDELYRKLQDLLERRHANPEEVERAVLQRELAAARLESVQEQVEIRQLEYERIQARLRHRQITSPLDGFVLRVHKEVGEFVSPNDPVVVTVVQLDPLQAVLSVTSAALAELEVDQHVRLRMADERVAIGQVEFIAPVTDSKSGTTRIKVRIPNADQQWRSGQRCRLLPGTVSPPAAQRQATLGPSGEKQPAERRVDRRSVDRRLPAGLRFTQAPPQEKR